MASSNFFENVYTSLNKAGSSTLSGNLTAALTHATELVGHFLAGSGFYAPSSSPEPTTVFERFNAALTDLSTLETTSIFLACCTFLFLVMSWTQRLGNLGRFSPFTRSPPQGSTKVSDADFSYITADDLRRHQAESMGQPSSPTDTPSDLGPPRDTDVLILRNKKNEYAVHFAAYSIAKGELTIAQIREQAAKKMGAGDARRVKLLYKGRNLKDDSRTAKQDGLKDGMEIMCTVAEPVQSDGEDDDEDDDFEGINEVGQAEGETKRKRNRGKKSKRRNRREDRDGTSGTSTPVPGGPSLGLPNNPQTSRSHSPQPPTSPATPLDKLNALHQKLQSFVPDCEKFVASPPTEAAKRDFEHKRLTETILTQVLLKTDGVETEGDEEARMRRKALVKETQSWLNRLDAIVKS